jgi:hypothetical protein
MLSLSVLQRSFAYIRKYRRISGFAIGNPGQSRVPRLVKIQITITRTGEQYITGVLEEEGKRTTNEEVGQL